MATRHIQLTLMMKEDAKQQTGLEQEALIPAQIHFGYIMATTGLVLLLASTPTTLCMSNTLVISPATTAATSTTSTTVCVPALQLRLRNLQSKNRRINHCFLSKIKMGGSTTRNNF